MRSLLINNAQIIATMDGKSHKSTGTELSNFSIYSENGIIKKIFSGHIKDIEADLTIDASNHIVIPGLINTHHHMFQTLTKAVKPAQNTSLFDWLKALYPIWINIKPEHIQSAVSIALAEMIISGCTTTSDHLYIFPNGVQLEDTIEISNKVGIRFHATRGSMSIGVSKGGLPPDDLIEDEDIILKDSQRVIEKWNDPHHNSMLRIALAPCSPFSVSKDLMKNTAHLAREFKVGLHTHLAENNEDIIYSKEKFGMLPGEYAESLGWTGKDVWHAHCVKLNSEEIDLFSKTNTSISHCPCSNMRLGSGIIPLKKIMDKNISVGLGVDGSASNDSGNLLNEARLALYLQRVKNGGNTLNARQALWIGTAGGSATLNRKDIGVIKEGNSADFAIYDLSSLEFAGAVDDPLAALVFCGPFRTRWTICNGKIISEKSWVKNFDLPDTIEKHNKFSKSLLMS